MSHSSDTDGTDGTGGTGDAELEATSGPLETGRRLIAVDHVRLGRWFLVFALVMGLWGGLDAVLLRTTLVTPTLDHWSADVYSSLFTTHGLTMLFLFAVPVIWGFAYATIPSLIRAERTAFPALAAAAFWLQIPAAILVRAGTIGSALDVAGLDPVAIGWTMYPPMSVTSSNPAVDALVAGLLFVAISTSLTAADLVVTVCRRRTIPWSDVDTFTWTVVTSAAMAVVAFPVLAGSLALLLLERAAGVGLLVGRSGPMVWLNLFWFFAHPLVYILVLPPMGITSHVLPRFAGRRLFGRRSVVYSTFAIGILSFTVWGHHLFMAGMSVSVRAVFMFVTLAVAVPSSAKLCTWLGTLWGGAIQHTAPMIASIAAIAFFIVGGVTGVFLAVAPINVLYNGTYYVVAHFHMMLVGFVAFTLVAGGYYWFPLLTGRWYDPTLAHLHVWLTIVGIIVTFGALFVVGFAELPRRIATYPPAFAPIHQLATVGAYVIAVGQLVFLLNIGRSLWVGERAGDDPWGLADEPSHAREW
ncbi:cytochrome c oxidase subunit I [Natrialba asiatica]|uniref:Cytochrome C oxidase subunit I n=1 Tax=Natrialba asiatica (strain ATCC 700177 / DSM 12278 / JCM 9576 / FERM P-10747 / NBRC 102637 / 172P1) TaxID=29540 RepID=M0AMJ6_NATA1|nr:cbb3-type cytochrome c oxidase subunit I [Natrialba asiatica]ELY99541.1 cytochrome C oxidase subunit I [Natrialba asiatica DSM 12278]